MNSQLKLQTPVEVGKSLAGASLEDKFMVIGSCFADNIGKKLSDLDTTVCVNPFGTLYNPVSICNSISRLDSGIPFESKDCVQMGAGSELICSFSHHTSFARRSKEEFLDAANSAFTSASASWKEANKVIITLGTAWCFEFVPTGEIVSNCLKIDAKQFRRRLLKVNEAASMLKSMVARFPGKDFIFTLSPIRHLKDGAHGNQLSKSILLLAIEEVIEAFPSRACYFPAYEILLDELRDYRFYAEDMLHPSPLAIDHIWRRFLDFAFSDSEICQAMERERAFRSSQHRKMH